MMICVKKKRQFFNALFREILDRDWDRVMPRRLFDIVYIARPMSDDQWLFSWIQIEF